MRAFRVVIVAFAVLFVLSVIWFLSGEVEHIRRLICRGDCALKVGVLHSLSGSMASSEKPVVDATLLAIDEVNRRGGVLGRKIEAVVADGASDPERFRVEAERLITKERVKVLFGCWTSSSRKAVKPVVESHEALLFYPVQYEGFESSPNIVYLGATPNQQLIPTVKWACDRLGKRFYFVGSDYIYPRVAGEIAKRVVNLCGGEVVGEDYLALGEQDFSSVFSKIDRSRPDIVLNMVNGDSNIGFFRARRDSAGAAAEKPAVLLMSAGENEVDAIRQRLNEERSGGNDPFGIRYFENTYASWSYFECIPGAANRSFVRKFKEKLGQARRVTDPMDAAYAGVWLWSMAVNENGSMDDTTGVLDSIRSVSQRAPGGIFSISENNHARRVVRIAKVGGADGFDIVWSSSKAVEPEPYPAFLGQAWGERLLRRLFRDWDGSWAPTHDATDPGTEGAV